MKLSFCRKRNSTSFINRNLCRQEILILKCHFLFMLNFESMKRGYILSHDCVILEIRYLKFWIKVKQTIKILENVNNACRKFELSLFCKNVNCIFFRCGFAWCTCRRFFLSLRYLMFAIFANFS